MNKYMEKKLELLNELVKYLEKNKIKYYVEGDLLINIYNNIEIDNNIKFNVSIIDNELINPNGLINKNRNVEKIYDKSHNLVYRYINKNTLYYDLYDKNNSKGIYIEIKTNRKDYKNYKKVKLNNFSITVPKNLDLYLEETYGLGYKYLKEIKTKIPGYVITNTSISFNDYEEELKNNNIKINKKIIKKANTPKKKEKDLQKITKNYRDLVSRTHSRFKLLELYEDKKDNILKLDKEKKYNELENILKDYLYEIKKYYDLNMGLCFDKDIFDVTIDYLKYDKQEKLANWLLKNTPEKHLCNIDFTYKDKNKTKDGQLKDLQNCFVTLLENFDNVCKQNNITYFVDSGSVLGAIRHGGFIPWDDDVDVLLTYDNWKKLVKVMENNPIKDTEFVCIENNPNHTLYTGKIFNKKSTKVYYSYSLLDSTYGYHLDVLIADEYIDNKYLRKIHNALFYLYGQILNPNELRYNRNISFLVNISNLLMKIFGRDKFLAFLRKLIFNNKNKNSKYYAYRWQKQMKLNKDIFEKQLYVPFDRITVPIPIKYEEYLESSYGESWYIIPLPEDRLPSKRVFNLYVPYYLYQDDYMSFIDKKETNKAYQKLKMIKMKKCNLTKKANNKISNLKFYRDKLEINNEVDINEVKELFENNEYGKIREYLNNYYSYQNKKTYLNNGLLFFDDKEFLYDIVYTLIMCGEFYNARKILKSPKIKEILKDEFNALNKLMDNVKHISKKDNKDKINLFKKHPYCINFYLEYYSLIKDKKEKQEEINKFNNTYPTFGEVMYINALYNLEENNIKAATDLLNKAKENTRNGLLIKKIDEILKDLDK